LDTGEDPVDGLKREVKEETGLSIEVIKPYYVYHYIDEADDSVVEIAFICKVMGSNEVSLSPEHQEYKWITADQTDSVLAMTDMVREAIKKGFSES
jgi:8-oxo-dGTP diphosphatase